MWVPTTDCGDLVVETVVVVEVIVDNGGKTSNELLSMERQRNMKLHEGAMALEHFLNSL